MFTGINKNIVTLIAGVMLWFLVSYITGSLCLIQSTIGFPCPACGSVRAVLYLTRSSLRGAFAYHPLILASLGLLVYFAARYVFRKNAELHKIEKWIVIFFITAYMVLYVVRMFLFFPHTEPFVPNENALWRQIFRLVASLINRI